MWNKASPLPITPEQRDILERWVRAGSTSQSVARRARIVLMAAGGVSNNRIASTLETTRTTVIAWRRRFEAGGPEALTKTAPGRGRKPSIPAEKVKRIIEATLRTRPPGATHWSCRTMAKAQGVSPSTVQRIWHAHGLKPHQMRTFKLSGDPRFVEKLADVVGLYLNPPDKGIVLCVDEKSQIQALDRSQPGLPLKRGRAGTMTHDYKRNGTTTLFAALNLLEGTIFGQCLPRHRHQEFLKFLRRLDRQFPPDLDLHLVVDNYGTHTHKAVKTWLAAHPRFRLHFTPTGSSWLNLVERWFRELSEKRLQRGVFRSVAELEAAIHEFLDDYNSDPKPFVWTASVESILEKVGRCRAILETVH